MSQGDGLLSSIKTVDRKTIGLLLLLIALFFMNIARIHNNIFWYDECLNILSTESFDKTINFINDDANHPPLYSVLFYLFCSIFGRSPESYQLFSFIPWLIMLLLSITVIKKRYGFTVALIFMILCSLLNTSIVYITEVRSYEWDALLLLVDYLLLDNILRKHSKKDYYFFTITSIVAMYFHYFCIFAVAVFYLIIVIDAYVNEKTKIKITMASIALSVICYMPWLIIAFNSLKKNIQNYWESFIPGFADDLAYLFSSPGYPILLAIVLLTCVTYIIVTEINSCKNDNNKISEKSLWLIGGIGSIIISILVTEIILIINPLIIFRYLYPISAIAWLLFSYSIVKCWNDEILKKTVTVSTILLLLIVCLPCYHDTIGYEKNTQKCIDDTLYQLRCIETDDYIYSDVPYFDLGVLDYYLPDIEHSYDFRFPNDIIVDKTRNNYLFTVTPMNDEIELWLDGQGMTYETVKENANIGGYFFNAYKLVSL